MKKLPVIVVLFALSVIFVPSTWASGFYLKTIGSLSVEGSSYNHYWYTGTNVAFAGVAPAGASVTVTVDGTVGSATVDGSGNWSYSTTLAEGDHSISVASSTSASHTFTLTIGTVPEGVGAIGSTGIPQAGAIEPTLLLLGGGSTLVFVPFLKKYLRR